MHNVHSDSRNTYSQAMYVVHERPGFKSLKQQIFVATKKKPIEGKGIVKVLICYSFEYSVDDKK